MKTTKKDYALFKGYCDVWLKKLGLNRWAVYYYHEEIEEAYAQTVWNINGMCASIRLSTHWDEGRELNNKTLEQLALHEVLHVLLAELINHAEDRYTKDGDIQAAEHAIIRQLENTLLA